MEVSKIAGKTWKIIEKASLPLMLAVIGWALLTIMALQNRVIKIEQKAKEDEAQWRLLQQQGSYLQEQKVEVEVYKRMFEMLLDKNQIKTDRISLPALPNEPRRTYEDFRTEQMQLIEREIKSKK